MNLSMFTVYDQAAKLHHAPFVMPQIAMANRAFTDWVNNPEHPYGKHPEDYSLLRIAEWNEDDGQLIPLDVPESLGLGSKFVTTK